MFGKHPHLSPETVENIRLSKLGDKNPMWKGDNVGNKALHEWVRGHLPEPEQCQVCEINPPRDLANMTGIYNRDFKNWVYLCRRCHMESDGRMEILRQDGIRRL